MKTMYSVLYIPWEFRCHILEHKTLASCFSTFIIKTSTSIFFQMHLSYFLISKSSIILYSNTFSNISRNYFSCDSFLIYQLFPVQSSSRKFHIVSFLPMQSKGYEAIRCDRKCFSGDGFLSSKSYNHKTEGFFFLF